METRDKVTARNPFQTLSSSWWLYFTGRALLTIGVVAGFLLIFVGMALDWALLPTFAGSGGLIVFGLVAYVVFRAFGDVVVRITDIHNLLEQRFNKDYEGGDA